MNSSFSLSDLAIGDQAIIGDLTHCPADYRRSLAHMGILPNTPITVTRRAPLGDPIEIAVRGYRLTLRQHEAAQISLLTHPATDKALA